MGRRMAAPRHGDNVLCQFDAGFLQAEYRRLGRELPERPMSRTRFRWRGKTLAKDGGGAGVAKGDWAVERYGAWRTEPRPTPGCLGRAFAASGRCSLRAPWARRIAATTSKTRGWRRRLVHDEDDTRSMATPRRTRCGGRWWPGRRRCAAQLHRGNSHHHHQQQQQQSTPSSVSARRP